MKAALIAFALAAPAAVAQTPQTLLRDAAETLAVAERAAASDAERRLAIGRATAALERALALIRADLRALAERRAPLRETLTARRGAALAALAAAERLGRAPPAAFFAHPGGPVAASRAGMALAAAAPRLADDAAAARAAVTALAAAEEERRRLHDALRAASRDLRAARDALGRATLATGALDAAAARADLLAADVESALAAFPATVGVGEDPPRGAAPPVSGPVTRPAGEGRGVEVAAPAWGAARAPWPATLRFAGPVAGRGEVAILEGAPGLLLVIAGLARIDRAQGDALLAGEAFGWVGGPPPGGNEFFIDAAADHATIPTQTIHIDMRRDGAPEDPEAWFAFRAERTDG